MEVAQKATSGVEWRVTMADGSSKVLVPDAEGLVSKAWKVMKDSISDFVLTIRRFLKKAWNLGVDDPRKFIHGLKVGLALTVVSLFYYVRPLYEGFGGNAMWAVMTVVVVFENTVGQTIWKSLNRISGTTLAGLLAIAVHWVADQSGEHFEPVVVGVAIFLLASSATFSRFIPKVKELFDYGALIFILTFSFVAISGYRVDELFHMAQERMSTIAIGASFCIIITMVICPIWAGQELHGQIYRNMEKLANCLEGCVTKYFDPNKELAQQSDMELLGYKCVLTSKASEESMATFARWEPAHGNFNFRHPWKQYVTISASMRNCAYSIDALRSCVAPEDQAPNFIKNHLRNICLRVSSTSSGVIKELATSIKTMKNSSNIDFLVEEMSSAVLELQNTFNSLHNSLTPSKIAAPGKNKTNSTASVSLMEIIPAATLASLLIEIAAQIEGIVDAVKELAKLAEFEDHVDKSSKPNQPYNRIVPAIPKDEASQPMGSIAKPA